MRGCRGRGIYVAAQERRDADAHEGNAVEVGKQTEHELREGVRGTTHGPVRRPFLRRAGHTYNAPD
jgi:hypothetical protein